MGRRRKLKLAAIARRVFFFVAGSLMMAFLAVFLNAVLALYLARPFAMPIAVGVAVAVTLALLKFAKHPPLFMRNVPPLAAGLCAGLGVHLARLWLK